MLLEGQLTRFLGQKEIEFMKKSVLNLGAILLVSLLEITPANAGGIISRFVQKKKPSITTITSEDNVYSKLLEFLSG